uniref:ATP synthase F0 subunit 6 n=1 Tax=Nandigallia matai TaxID=1792639 RepID=UPI0030034FBF|nr:ATP synthase F0 subunit 6 [Nandigallia matai]
MMNNLFSVFDPCTGNMSMNWTSMFLVLMIMPFKYWMMNNKQSLTVMTMISSIYKEMKTISNQKGSSIMFITMFMMIIINNLMGLLPYTFTASSHLSFSLAMAIPMWMSFMMFGWTMKNNLMFAHLVPMGTPSILMPFMVMIETISNMIRPGSLAVRLTANMIAGHLLMSLLGNNCTNLMMISILMTILITLMIFELAVAMIQGYVFMTLMNLYSSEI